MGNKLLFIAAIGAVVTIGAAYFLQASAPVAASNTVAQTETSVSNASAPSAAETQPAAKTPAPAPTQKKSGLPAQAGYTMRDVALHNSAGSCWSAINGKVYNLTNWINQHPGGAAAILSLCGTDGSAPFNAQHDATGRPERVLETFFVGNLI